MLVRFWVVRFLRRIVSDPILHQVSMPILIHKVFIDKRENSSTLIWDLYIEIIVGLVQGKLSQEPWNDYVEKTFNIKGQTLSYSIWYVDWRHATLAWRKRYCCVARDVFKRFMLSANIIDDNQDSSATTSNQSVRLWVRSLSRHTIALIPDKRSAPLIFYVTFHVANTATTNMRRCDIR